MWSLFFSTFWESHKDINSLLLTHNLWLTIRIFCNLLNCCLYIRLILLFFYWYLIYIYIYIYVFIYINPFIYKYTIFYVLKRNLIPEYLLSWFFFTEGAICLITSAPTLSKYSHHVYTSIQKDVRVSDNFASKSVAQRNEDTVILVCKGEGCRALELDYVLCVSNYFISLRIIPAEAEESDRYRYIFSISPFLFFLATFRKVSSGISRSAVFLSPLYKYDYLFPSREQYWTTCLYHVRERVKFTFRWIL